MNSDSSKFIYWLLLALVIVASAVWAPQSVSDYTVAFQQATGLFTVLVVLALVVERAQEVVLTVLRAAGSEARSLALARLMKQHEDLLARDEAQAELLTAKITEAKQEHLGYRAETRVMALYFGLFLGVLISSAGFRILHGLVPAAPLNPWQGWLYSGLDILLSGAVIAGGSDGVHKLAEAYRTTLSRVSGREPG